MISFTKEKISELVNPKGDAGAMNLACVVGDLMGSGYPDIVIAPRFGRLVWFENLQGKGWSEHCIDPNADGLEAGGVLYDLTGNGTLDLIIGGHWKNDELYWYENPGDLGVWKKHVIFKSGGHGQYHDQIIGKIKRDGKVYLAFWNNRIGDLYCVGLPEDPRVTPWPGIELIRRGNDDEGLAIADVDGDGFDELIAGNAWYSFISPEKGWRGYTFAGDYVSPRLAAADFDGDGKVEILISEGDVHMYDRPEGGRAAIFSREGDPRHPWREAIIGEGLLDPHTLQIGDFCGNRNIDILIGEIGIPGNPGAPRMLIFENNGKGHFTCQEVASGQGTHEGKAADFRRAGVLDFVGKPLFDPEKWEISVYYNNGKGE